MLLEHHLFPNMPRPNLRRAQPPVQAYCVANDISHSHSEFPRSYGHILSYLHSIGAPLRADHTTDTRT